MVEHPAVNRRVVGSSPTRGARTKGPLRRAFCISWSALQARRATKLLPRFLIAKDSRLRPASRIGDERALEVTVVPDRRRDVAMAHLPAHVFDRESQREPDGRGEASTDSQLTVWVAGAMCPSPAGTQRTSLRTSHGAMYGSRTQVPVPLTRRSPRRMLDSRYGWVASTSKPSTATTSSREHQAPS